MSLNSKYIIASDLQSLFRDKDTGAPLADGYIKFYQDNARTTPKNVYILSGVAPNYSYISIGSTVELSAIGTVQYLGRDTILYYYPYDDEGNVQNYFVKVYSSGDVEQFTREAWPNITSGNSASGEQLINYVPDGQFLLHQDIEATGNKVAGQITEPVTVLSQGGWTFERPSGSTATDLVTFEPYGSYVSEPTGNPPFACRIRTTVPDEGDTYKDLRLKFRNVNMFASSSQENTYSFVARTNVGTSITVQLILCKNYGEGGSSPSEQSLESIVITSEDTIINVPFVFGTNEGKTIGDGSYVQLAIRLPPTEENDVVITNAILTPNSVIVSEYPQTTEAMTLASSLAGWFPVPAYDGSDLYLPIRLTPTGLEFDHSVVGEVVASSGSRTAQTGQLLADGSAYDTTARSSDGIPYSRIGNYYLENANVTNVPLYGTGADFVTAYIFAGDTTQINMPTNTQGSVTNISDGTPPTGFTFATIFTGHAFNYIGYLDAAGNVIVRTNSVTTPTAPTAGTSGFTITVLRDDPDYYYEFQIQTVAAAGLAGDYMTFGDNFIWFKVDGAGSIPSVPGKTGYELDLKSTYTALDVANCIKEAISGQQISTIICTTVTSGDAGSYFNFDTLTDAYYVWLKVDGLGTDPLIDGRIGIEADLLTTNTAAQNASAIQLAINSRYVAVPNLQGLFLRGYDPNHIWDLDYESRFSSVGGSWSDYFATIQFSANQNITQNTTPGGIDISTESLSGPGGPVSTPGVGSGDTGAVNGADWTIDQKDFGVDARPINATVTWFIKY